MKILQKLFPKGKNKYVEVVEQVKCTGEDHLQKEVIPFSFAIFGYLFFKYFFTLLEIFLIYLSTVKTS